MSIASEDETFFKGNPAFANFLSGVSLEEEAPQPKPKKRKLEVEDEADFEKRPRTWSSQKDRLPVFDAEGKLTDQNRKTIAFNKPIVQPEAVSQGDAANSEQPDEEDEPAHHGTDPEDNPEHDGADSDDDDGAGDNDGDEFALQRAVKLVAERKRRRLTLKEKIAATAVHIMEEPHKQYKLLGELLELCTDHDVIILKLALISTATLFKDIIPGYTIREGEDDKDDKLSKHYGKMRDFELGMLASYRSFLALLDRGLKGKLGSKLSKAEAQEVRLVTINGLCSLLVTHPHFNFHKNIMTSLIPFVDSKNVVIRTTVSKAFEEIIAQDKTGSVTLEIVRELGNQVKSRKFGSGTGCMALLLRVKLREDLLMDAALKEKVRKQRKKKQKADEVAKALAQAEAEHRREVILVTHEQILDAVFVTFVRILKSAPKSPLMPQVLQGVAKFGHLINVDLVQDLIVYLSELINDDEIGVDVRMEVFLALHTLKQGEGQALSVDNKKAHVFLYRCINFISGSVSLHRLTLFVQCLQRFIQDKKQIEAPRVAAFVKRLLTLCLRVPAYCVVPVLAFVRAMLDTWPSTQQLLEQDALAGEAYNPTIDDPDFANAFSSVAWELVALSHSTHPDVADVASQILAKNKTISVAGVARFTPDNAVAIAQRYDSTQGSFFPAVPPPKEHSMRSKVLKTMEQGDLRRLPRPVQLPTPSFALQLPTINASQVLRDDFHRRHQLAKRGKLMRYMAYCRVVGLRYTEWANRVKKKQNHRS